MSDSLRSGLIEVTHRYLDEENWSEQYAERLVDRQLDYLTDHADEWATGSLPKGAVPVVVLHRADTASRLLAVLRSEIGEQ